MSSRMNIDPETGLLTEAAFNLILAESIQSRKESKNTAFIAVLSIQLDRFLEFEESLDTDTAERLVQATAERLNGCVRTKDRVCRVDGAHFRVLVDPLHSTELAASIADKICQVLRLPYTVGKHFFSLSASVGISVYPHDSRLANTLTRQADHCMGHALMAGDRFQFNDRGLTTSLGRFSELEDDPREALNNNQFELHYQPRVDLGADEVISTEALIRWRHPVHGLIPPGEFIGLAESTGLIHELGAWVLDEACTQLARWQVDGFRSIRMSINVSGRQLDHPDFPGLVERVLARTGIAAELLELEITESAIMRRPAEVADTLTRIRDLGVRIALDDFGTGQSSLAYLRRFPLDTLKIDRSFILDISAPDPNVVLLRSIIDLAHALNLRVVAEGVETTDQRETLNTQGCDEIQGFLISPAVPEHQFRKRSLRLGQGARSSAGQDGG